MLCPPTSDRLKGTSFLFRNKYLLMGNHASSCFRKEYSATTKAKLIDAQGNARQVSVPVKAAEVMLEYPGHVVIPVDKVQSSQRIVAMRADDELLAGQLYLLVRMSRVNGKVTKQEAALVQAASASKKKTIKMKKRSGAKVLPAVTVNDDEPGCSSIDEKKESFHRVIGNTASGFSCSRFVKLRQWNPVLASISEVY